MVARLVHSADFERLRATRPWARSEHFAVHHLPTRPFERRGSDGRPAPENLSTSLDHKSDSSVDKSADAHWLGCVLPKRLARRAVTRNLLRRQIRAAMARHEGELAPGLWVVRLRATFARTDYPSAASQALRLVVRGELDALLAAGAARAAARARST
ncbi:MAG: ribonuclease P protein component [Burkholderiales bacterium]|nr:ribonuclease P protein component [Burkholderiales bacterium]